jgi:NitT/TauT family transport system substrate-binding protein
MTRYSRRDVLRIGAAASIAAGFPRRVALARTPIKATQVTGVLYAAHLVAESQGFFKKENVDVELLASPAGARSAQMLAAGQVHFVLGDSSHAQRLTEQGKPTSVLYVTDQKCPYANITVRKELYDAGATSLDKLATMKPKSGDKWKAGATAIGSGTWMYGNYVLRSRALPGGKTLNDHVEWVGVGGIKAALGAMKTGKIDLNMSVPEAILEADKEGIGKTIFDVRDDAQWNAVFKGPISATCGYALKTTTTGLKDETQAYVTSVYKAVQWLKASSPVEIARVLERYQETMGLSGEAVVKSVEWYKHVWTYDMVFTRENYDNVLNVAKGIKAEKTYPYEEIVDESFLRKAAGRA